MLVPLQSIIVSAGIVRKRLTSNARLGLQQVRIDVSYPTHPFALNTFAHVSTIHKSAQPQRPVSILDPLNCVFKIGPKAGN